MPKIQKNRIYGDTLTAVIYARYSCDKQTEQSIEGQLECCHKYADSKGIKVIGTYTDRAISGRTDDRPEFMQMIKDSAKGEFDYVIVYKLDRFSRNRYNSAMYKNKLKQNGVAVLSAMENLSDGPESVMLEAMLEGMAEYYSLELSQKVKRGMAVSASKGNSVGGTPPLGYYYGPDKKLHINEHEAAAVRMAYEMYADGIGKKEIADKLNAAGYRTRTGKLFTVNSFERVLNNPKYTGNYCYNGEITAPGGCPKIIEPELFNRVQSVAKIKKYAPSSNRSEHKYPLSGKLFCGCCGAPMTGYKGTSRNGNPYYYYACNNHRRHLGCAKRNEVQDFLDWFVSVQTKAMLSNKEQLRIFAESFEKFYENEYGTTELTNAEAELSKLNTQIENIVDVIATTGNSALVTRLEQLQAQQQEVMHRVQELRISEKATPSADDIMKWFENFGVGDEHQAEFRKCIIANLINAVFVSEDSIAIVWNTGDADTVTFSDYISALEKEKTSANEMLANVRSWLPLLDLNQRHRD